MLEDKTGGLVTPEDEAFSDYTRAVITLNHDASAWVEINCRVRVGHTRDGLQTAHRMRHDILLQTLAVARKAWGIIESTSTCSLTTTASSTALMVAPETDRLSDPTFPACVVATAFTTDHGTATTTTTLTASATSGSKINGTPLQWLTWAPSSSTFQRALTVREGDAIDLALELGACLIVEKIGGHTEGKHERDGFLESHLFRRTTIGCELSRYMGASLPALVRCYVLRSSEQTGYAFLRPVPLLVAILPAVTTDLRIKQAANAFTRSLTTVCAAHTRIVMHGLYGHGNQQSGTPSLCAALLRKVVESQNCEVVVQAKTPSLAKLYSELCSFSEPDTLPRKRDRKKGTS